MTNHEVEEVDLNNLNELDVNENSAGGGAHEEAMKAEFPTTLSWDAPKEVIKDFVKKVKEAQQEAKLSQGTAGFVAPYDYPLDKAFQYGYNVDIDPLNELFKLASKNPPQNKVKIDDTIESDILKTEDLRLGRLYRVTNVGLIVRFAGQVMLEERGGVKMNFVKNKILLKIKHHGTLLYVEERQLVKASKGDVADYLNQPF
jgi:hypothetical protein